MGKIDDTTQEVSPGNKKEFERRAEIFDDMVSGLHEINKDAEEKRNIVIQTALAKIRLLEEEKSNGRI